MFKNKINLLTLFKRPDVFSFLIYVFLNYMEKVHGQIFIKCLYIQSYHPIQFQSNSVYNFLLSFTSSFLENSNL